jgi:hypothetical protein
MASSLIRSIFLCVASIWACALRTFASTSAMRWSSSCSWLRRAIMRVLSDLT